jgi:hypothetical protein
MNTNLNTVRPTRRATALAACLGLLFAGATACGTEHAAPPAKTGNRPASLSSNDLVEKEKANQKWDLWYLQLLKAQRPDAARPTPGFGDDRRQQQAPPGFGDDRRQQQAPS